MKIGGFYMVLIGIDPDVDKNGFALIHNKNYELANLTFFELYDKLQSLKNDFENESIKVFVECGFLNKSNWHKVKKGSASINANIGNRTGRNHEVAHKIIEMCEYLNLTNFKVKPTSKKRDNKEFSLITGIKKRTNQEQRDAMFLIFGK
ncbi:MAG: hypothetical protein RSD53_05835 [Algoriella sp.]|uniref:hypothetical protein n=1 Tax=Algoriella sp. TaxID=1872434 RepID=UPI002FCA0822